MDCEEAQVLSIPHIMGDLERNSSQHRELEVHLVSCRLCAAEYERSKWTVEFIQQNTAIFAEVFENMEKTQVPNQEQLKRGWDSIQAKIEARQRRESLRELRRPLWRPAAAAACIAIAVSLWLVLSNSDMTSQRTRQQPVAAATPLRIEVLSGNGNVVFVAGTEVRTTHSELKTLIINGKHQIVMNRDTVLSISQLAEGSRCGCLVNLALGEVFARVEHDGSPFVVGTANGKAVITGTTFDVKATDASTTLVVSEGTVKFESEKGVVRVAAGQTSKIVNQSAPSIPLSCNTAEFTAWATGYKAGPALARTELNPEPWDLPLSFGEKPIVLAETDYEQWVGQKREWFKKDFPWIFELKDAFAGEGIEVDYPELLIKSGDVWQFVCLQKFPARFSVPDFESLLKIAICYGFDKDWLLKNVPTAKIVQNKSSLLQNLTGLAAFVQWLKYAKGHEESPAPYYSADAGKYLAETRSLIWFAVNVGKFKLTDEQRVKVLDLLQQEVIAATNCSNNLLYPEDEKKKPLCGDVCETPEMKMAGYIEMIKTIEEKIMEYEICK